VAPFIGRSQTQRTSRSSQGIDSQDVQGADRSVSLPPRRNLQANDYWWMIFCPMKTCKGGFDHRDSIITFRGRRHHVETWTGSAPQVFCIWAPCRLIGSEGKASAYISQAGRYRRSRTRRGSFARSGRAYKTGEPLRPRSMSEISQSMTVKAIPAVHVHQL